MTLEDLRKRIDELDEELVSVLNERLEVVLEVGELKKEQGGEIYVPSREKAVFERIEKLNKGPLPSEAAKAIYREIMSAALKLESHLKVAYLGPPATFTHQAAQSKFGASVEYLPVESIGDVFEMVESGSADYGVVPVENSTEGAVTNTFDRFSSTPLKICAEVYLPISLNLLANGPKDGITKIYSKEEVFGQCRRWLTNNLHAHVELISADSTTAAAKIASEEKGSGAIASSLAAELYPLDLVDENIQDVGGNTTRFLVIGRAYSGATSNDKTSIYFGVKDKAGALHDALATLKENEINMTKIESRPSRNKTWEYYFFIDFEGHAGDPHVQKALDELSEHCAVLNVLGSYPKAEQV